MSIEGRALEIDDSVSSSEEYKMINKGAVVHGLLSIVLIVLIGAVIWTNGWSQSQRCDAAYGAGTEESRQCFVRVLSGGAIGVKE